MFWPGFTDGGPLLVMERSASVAPTFVVALPELLLEFGSDVVAETVAVLVTLPLNMAGVLYVNVIVAGDPTLIVPRMQGTVVVPLQLPWLGVAETNPSGAGGASVPVTPAAVYGPAFAAQRV